MSYAKPIVLGGALGIIALFIIALLGGPLFTLQKVSDIGDALVEVGAATLPWDPLAIVIAAIALWLSDNPVRGEPSCSRRFARALFARAARAALVMMGVGFLSSSIAYREHAEIEGVYMSLFIAGQIGLITVVLCIVLQMCELYTDRARWFAGKYIEASTRQGRLFCMLLDRDGTACLLPPDGGSLKSSAVVCRGHWQQFPEGTAVKWDREDGHCGKAGGFGLISAFGDLLIYEGYSERFSGTPDFLAQLNVRTNADTRAKPPSPTGRPPTTEPPVPRALPTDVATDVTVL